ncbi:uncharacterized protein [Triticum aestivum]|uniref:uncharacterized protein n=1 Tax=Triticum aestivum TaxID=4565 RepID=UPI001D035624|nr:uncharacterized protein LOC123056811 [Triticum aestivum]
MAAGAVLYDNNSPAHHHHLSFNLLLQEADEGVAAIQATLAADASVAAIPRSSRRIRPRASLTNPRSPPLPALSSLLTRSHRPSSVAAAPLTLWRSGATPRRQLLSRKTTIHDYIIYGSGLARNTAASTPSPSSSTFDPDLRRPGSALRQAPGPSELVIGLPGMSEPRSQMPPPMSTTTLEAADDQE